jgi:ubiquinone biosynthesis protein UbiJ
MGREVVRLLQTGMTAEAAAKHFAVSLATLNAVRDITILSESDDLGEADIKIVAEAVKLMDANQQVRESMSMVKPIADRLWGEKGQRFKTAKSRIKQFANSIRIVRTTCENAADLTIPYVNKVQAKEFHEQLAQARHAIEKLADRIKEEVR